MIKHKKKFNLILLCISIPLIIYSILVFRNNVHYNTVAQIDNLWLDSMFQEFAIKNKELPVNYDDLRTATVNLHILIEKDYWFVKPSIKFTIQSTVDSITVNFYETGFDGKDDKLNKVINSPFSVFCLYKAGDFFIGSKKYAKSNLQIH